MPAVACSDMRFRMGTHFQCAGYRCGFASGGRVHMDRSEPFGKGSVLFVCQCLLVTQKNDGMGNESLKQVIE